MSQQILGVGEMGVVQGDGKTLKIYALGSCVATVLWERESKTLAVSHVALPESANNPEKAREMPGYFADTAVVEMINRMKGLGAKLERGGVVVKLVGGAQMMDQEGTFNIGKRNVLTLKKVLWAKGMAPLAEEVGSDISRTVTIYSGSGKVEIATAGLESRVL
ncbi:MAG: chemotaxis protein CheD [Deltaproteobacteria bacterium]|nr:chemotaxis protein CheD [Deltaproteobacteria bacterium]